MAKGIKNVFIESDSVGVLGTRIYRDGILIGTVPVGTAFYNDPTAIEGVEYKYVNQAYTIDSESTDEILGVNMGYYTITGVINTLMPVLSNFRIESNDNRIYFDSSEVITGSTYAGFTASGKTVNGIQIQSGTTGHYLTVTSAFNYWDNMLVWYNGTDIKDLDGNDVYPFYQDDVYNSAPEPVGTGNQYFVKVGGNDSLDGLSEANAWATLGASDSKLSAGDTLNVKAGNYGADFMNFQYTADGLIDNPIKIIGYQVTPSDITTNYWDYGTPISSVEMPLIDGANGGSNTGIGLSESSYYIIKNIQVTNTRYGATMFGSGNVANNITFDRCNFTEQGNTGTSGYGIYSTLEFNSKITINSCGFLNATMINAIVTGNNNSIRNCKSYADSDDNAADYHYILSGRWNKIIGSHCEHVGNLSHSGHGISIKNQLYTTDPTFLVERCLAKDCTVKNVNGALEFRHSTVQYCYANNVTLDGSGLGVNAAGLVFRDGASFNVFDKGEIREAETDSNWYGAIYFTDTSEDGGYGQTLEGNEVRNTLIVEGGAGEYCINYGNNTTGANNYTVLNTKFYNNTFANHTNLHKQSSEVTVTGTEFTNNIFDNVTNLGNGQGATFLNNLFFGGFAAQGTGAITIDPDLDANYQPQATFTDIDVPKISGINYGKNGNERQDDTTVGSILSADEIASQPPVGDYDYYVSATGTGDGLTSDTPMSYADSQTTINSMTAGQSIAYKGGDEFFGSLSISGVNGASGNPITITSYGTGQAIIKGSKDISGWTNQGGNIWSASTGSDTAYQVFKDDSNLLLARMPFISSKETPSNSYYNVTTIYGVDNRFLSTDLIGLGLSTGSTVVISSREWTFEAKTVTAFNNSTGEVTLSSNTQYNIREGANFFVNNDPILLTEQDEWYYDSSTLSIYSTTEPTGISISTLNETAVTITNSDYISFDNIAIKYFNENAFEVGTSDFLTLNNLQLSYNYMQAANIVGSTNFTMTNSIVKGSNQETIAINGASPDANIYNNEFVDCGIFNNITSKNIRQSLGIYSAGARMNLELNTYNNIGWTGVFWIGENSTITKNVFTDYCQMMSDGGAIYSHNGEWSYIGATGSIASNNICVSTDFTDGWLAHGLYTDERCHDIVFRNNTVINGWYGIYLHNNKRIEYDDNNIYNQRNYGIQIAEDANGGEGETVDNNIHHNKIFEIVSNVECAFYRSAYTIPATGIFGTYDFNRYWNPHYVNLDTLVLGNPSSQFMTLSEWQTASGEDLNSSENPSLWTGGEQSQILYNDTLSVKDFPLTGTWYDLDGTQYVNEITLQQFTSAILISEYVAPPVDNLITNGDFLDGDTGGHT